MVRSTIQNMPRRAQRRSDRGNDQFLWFQTPRDRDRLLERRKYNCWLAYVFHSIRALKADKAVGGRGNCELPENKNLEDLIA
jgi:hypothetical protein